MPAGLLTALSTRLGRAVSGEDVACYVAALLAHPGYVERFSGALKTPGLRVPVTAESALLDEAVTLGRRVLWLHTYGACFADPAAGRPFGPPRVTAGDRPLVITTIDDGPGQLAEEIAHDAATRQLRVRTGVIEGVSAAVWAYEVSGFRVVKRWFDRRKREPEGRRSSPLDDVVATRWEPEWTAELVDLLHVLTLLVELEQEQDGLLGRILDGPLITTQELRDDGVLPSVDIELPKDRPAPEKPPRQGQL